MMKGQGCTSQGIQEARSLKKKGRKKDTEKDFPLEFLEVACLADTFNPVNLTLDFWLPEL